MIRSFQKEDASYIIDSHYEIYNREYQYDLSFRAFIERSISEFMQRSDYSKEHIWILERDGQPRGAVGITKVDEQVAQLRLFLVDPKVRGNGYGSKLIWQAIDFCKKASYQTVILWTNTDLKEARRLYEKHGFRLKETKTQTLSGQELIEERWELSLLPGRNHP
ncbi:GNAT family N-acetyltransferase [Brevibacillus ruminantium]|uniref:GNAT family N-acetyltransferase n=1 Tax=Brevibacillus ruminantium TaxID=2950604 RepID=A0ABY4WK07_9BACL|nr:GNAT family N-acetyltransferase [Brevibacillus ruminantium]USG67034.1 GNAT family N-acetyltransferase [Brevibacillus ruminantium]